MAEEVTQLNSLRHTLEDNNAKLDDRRKALVRIKQMVPSYHGELTNEGKLIKSNVNVLEQYINNLVRRHAHRQPSTKWCRYRKAH